MLALDCGRALPPSPTAICLGEARDRALSEAVELPSTRGPLHPSIGAFWAASKGLFL